MDTSLIVIVNWLEAGIRLGVPLLLVGIGAVYAERAGIVNLGMEGSMLWGALASVVVVYLTESVLLGTLAAVGAGLAIALIMAYLTINRRANQIVSGAAVNFFCLGTTNLVFAVIFRSERVRVAGFPVLSPEVLQNIPIIGPLLFKQSLLVWIALILPFISHWMLYQTTWGLNIRATGEHPHAVATAGISVYHYKNAGVLLSGMFAGLGGAALSLGSTGYFTQNMSAGRAFVVLAAVIVGNWKPIRVSIFCIIFGLADALQLRVQVFGPVIPYQFVVMLPYLLTIGAIAGLIGVTNPPKTWGAPYYPEEL